MANSITDPTFALPGASIPLAGSEDVVTLQGQFAVQTQLVDLLAGLVQSKGGKTTITGVKSSGYVAILGALLQALNTLGLITDATT
jgi:ABC-type taurine transport system ATPase subunit